MKLISLTSQEIQSSNEARRLIQKYNFLCDKWPGANIEKLIDSTLKSLPSRAKGWALTTTNKKWHWLIAWSPLIFDTKIFGLNIARILFIAHQHNWPQDIAKKQGTLLISKLIDMASNEGIEGFWVTIPTRDFLSAQVLESAGFHLYDLSVEWMLNLQKIITPSYYLSPIIIRPLTESDHEAILNLASLAFCRLEDYVDRFALDPFLKKKCSKLYRHWMVNAINGKAADQILILEKEKLPYGFIALKKNPIKFIPDKNYCGWIILNAINSTLRGKGYYRNLLNFGLNWLINEGIELARIRTKISQQAIIHTWSNLGARQVYADMTFHLWFNQRKP